MIKIAFFDVDGTIIDMEKREITEKMVATLQTLQKSGVKVCVATGRAPFILPNIDGFQFDAYLTFNGSYCYTQHDEIFSNPIPNEDVQKVVSNGQQINLPVILATKTETFANGTDDSLDHYMDISRQKVNVVPDFEEKSKQPIYQMMAGCTPSQYQPLLQGTKQTAITAWWDKAADIIPSTVNKGVGVEKILDYYHFTKDEAIAFGDGTNDLEMLQTVATSVAMENGTSDVKEIATYICGSVKEDGIYHFCKQHQLI